LVATAHCPPEPHRGSLADVYAAAILAPV
jgi:hypothetical protein